MIGMIIFYLITTTLILLIGLIFGKQRRFQKDNLDKAVRNAYDDGYKKGFAAGEQQAYDDGYEKGFAAGEQQGYNDGKLFSEIAAHNEKVLRKQGIIK